MTEFSPMVLVVDDDEAFRRSMTLLLTACGFAVRSFTCGEDLLAACDDEARGCLVIDVHLPGLDGFRTIEQLRARGSTLPALLMTGRPDESMREQAAAGGLPDVLEKPLPGHVLVQAIRTVLDLG